MQKTVDSPVKARPAILLVLSIAGALVYGLGCFVVFRGALDLDRAKQPPLNQELVARAERPIPPHRPEFYRVIADRLQYYPHNPKQLSVFYSTAIRKGPADYHNFFAYAYYLSSRNCCRQTVLDSVRESIRRTPTNPELYRIAASYYLTSGNRQQALAAIHHALELESDGAQTLYALLEQHGSDLRTLEQVTPLHPDAMIQLCGYLRSRGEFGESEFKPCVERLARLTLDPQQKIAVAQLAAQAGLEDIALRFSKAAAGSEEMRINAYRLLADQAWKDQKLDDYDRYTALMEKASLEQGFPDEAAEYALQAALRYQQRSKAEAIVKVLQVLKRYPRYADAYGQMAILSQDQSEQLSLYYIKKAVELAPSKLGYRNQLANYYLRASDFQNAELIFNTMIADPDGQETGYLGLALCKEKEGDLFQAVNVLQQALDKGIRTEPVLIDIARLYGSLGDYDKTLKFATALMDLNPDRSDAHLLAGEAMLNLGRYRESRDQYQLVLAKEPNNQSAKLGISRLESLGY